MRVVVSPSHLCGNVTAPPSKSMAHRLLICAGLAEGESKIEGLALSKDILATMDCLRALGASIEMVENIAVVRGTDPRSGNGVSLFCNESGSTLRFFLPICLLQAGESVLRGAARLLERPQSVYERLCAEKGLYFEHSLEEIRVKGRLTSGDFKIDGSVSSQFISGLLFALPLLDGDSRILIESVPESRPYLDMTLEALTMAGVRAEWRNECELFIPGNQRYHPIATSVEGDYSNAAFFEAMAVLGGDVTVLGLREDSKQGDAVYREAMARLKDGKREAIDLKDCPDLAPILIALAAMLEGGEFIGTKRLKWKECDRAEAMREELEKLGGRVTVEEDRILVEKTRLYAPKQILDGHNDHRIVMALTVLLTVLGGEIDGAEAVSKSMPDFFDRLLDLGGKVERHDC